MNSRLGRLVVLLRVAYLVGAGLFLLDVVLSITASTMSSPGPGDVVLTLPPDDVLGGIMDWIAVAAFGFAVIGAVITIVVVTLAGEPAEQETDH
ncbi:hypothetical protein VD659_11975 [Herbiconiux sp. 11R-BC]|uniref:hypothetical protein n=1 Tax=Herbiconiux sp. 11R-BC TaxID=3111637 RepID=UPI003C038360